VQRRTFRENKLEASSKIPHSSFAGGYKKKNMTIDYSNIRFARNRAEFFAILNQRVNQYFKTNEIGKNANSEMVVKTVFMFMLYFVPYSLLIFSGITSIWFMIAMVVVMGLGKAGIGLSVMHDAIHGGYSANPIVNKIMGFSLNIIGGNAFNWKVQHNVLHHTFTNVHEVDEDISPRGILRMAPDGNWHPIHKFQHWYAWIFYGLLTFVWIVFKDFSRLARYTKQGLVAKQKASILHEWITLVLSKSMYFGYILVIPFLLLPVTWWQVFFGFFIMHYVSGFILAIIFQPAHVIEGTEYPNPDAEGNLENNWAIHQMHTTTNFAQKSKLFSWYVGGLNFQVEHHLFPQICHVHYKKIAPIVEATAKEFGVPYKSKRTFMIALAAHWRLMKELGKKPQMAVA
jgi:linoleoyl-CoA desaturase